jgi:hypothetical protein
MAVCLHCLHEARVAARERRQRIIFRSMAWTLSVVVVGVVGVAGVKAARNPEPPPRQARRLAAKAVPVRDSAAVVQQGTPAPAIASTVDSAAQSPLPTPAAPTTSAGAIMDSTPAKTVVKDSTHAKAPAVPFGPVLPQGRTDLADSTFAVRRGETVVVHFDTSPLRTRRADKFELVVRQTLRAVYGGVADSALAAIPEGKLVEPNELVRSLPKKGIHLSAPGGIRLALWPETRQGRDGPLVVSYRTVVER